MIPAIKKERDLVNRMNNAPPNIPTTPWGGATEELELPVEKMSSTAEASYGIRDLMELTVSSRSLSRFNRTNPILFFDEGPPHDLQ
jgi:hypothetical protein